MSSIKIKAILKQIDPNALKIAQIIAKKDEEMKSNRAELKRLRLDQESQNTKLIRIQQEERKANDEYKQKKKDMEKILEELAIRADKFNEEQKKIYEDLEAKKDPVILKNDARKKLEDDKYNRDRLANKEKKELIKVLKQEKEKKANELKELEKDLARYRIYEDFLKQANDNTEDSKNSEKTILELINRYEKLEKNKQDFAQSRDTIEKDKDKINHEISAITKEMEDASYHYTSTINELKNRIDFQNQENRKMEMEIDGKYHIANSKQSEYGRIILAIKNLDLRSKAGLLTKEQSMKATETEKLDFTEQTDKLISKLDDIKKRIMFLSEVQGKINEIKNKETLEKSTKIIN